LEQIELILHPRALTAFRDGSVIRHSPSVASTTARALRQLGTRRPDIMRIPLAAVGAIATVLVMDVSAFTGLGVARWLRQLWGFTGQEPPMTEILRRLVTASTRLDTDGVIGVTDVVELHLATGQLHCRLNALAVPPGQ
jgi:hypothetical protein